MAAFLIVAVAVAVAGAGGSKPGLQRGAQAARTVSHASSLLAGIDQAGDVLGDPGAPVAMTYFGDLECPVCRAFTIDTLPQIIADQVRTKRLQIRYRSLETATSDPGTFTSQQVAALAAGAQDRMWQFVELFYAQQGPEGSGYVTASYLQNLAKQVPGLDVPRWSQERASSALADHVAADRVEAIKDGATATPTLIISGPRGTKTLSGNVPYRDVASAIGDVAGLPAKT
jgi:protein-disulfide isomerase